MADPKRHAATMYRSRYMFGEDTVLAATMYSHHSLRPTTVVDKSATTKFFSRPSEVSSVIGEDAQ